MQLCSLRVAHHLMILYIQTNEWKIKLDCTLVMVAAQNKEQKNIPFPTKRWPPSSHQWKCRKKNTMSMPIFPSFKYDNSPDSSEKNKHRNSAIVTAQKASLSYTETGCTCYQPIENLYWKSSFQSSVNDSAYGMNVHCIILAYFFWNRNSGVNYQQLSSQIQLFSCFS